MNSPCDICLYKLLNQVSYSCDEEYNIKNVNIKDKSSSIYISTLEISKRSKYLKFNSDELLKRISFFFKENQILYAS